MIAQLCGTVAHIRNEAVILDVGGVGYLVHITPETNKSLSEAEKACLYTHLAVRETALDLYGFKSEAELDFFELLITISGIGPKSALGILSLAGVETLTSAIAAGDTSYLTKVSGIGKKIADKIVLELQDKIGVIADAAGTSGDGDVIDALIGLGYSQKEAREAVKSLDGDVVDTNDRLKAALKILGKA